ncbi:nuclear transport factor 2 family protein [Rhodococcus fascians]|nr:nuclear transport factor 2 family protein [Rhodococcus fascians]MBY4433091.1 nuclear transport factor 2 family protein [Rhodococcus fascians]
MNRNLEEKVVSYLRTLEVSDFSSARSLFAGTATVWHNDGKGDETLEEYFEGLARQLESYHSIRYDIIRQFTQQDAVLQQHVVRVEAKNGERGGVHAAVYFRFDKDGLIERVEAYANYIPDVRDR